MKADRALAEFSSVEDFSSEIVGDENALSRAHLASGVNQSFPGEPIRRDWLGQKDFDLSGAMLAAAVKAGRQDAGIVEDEAVVGCEVGREVAKGAVFPLAGGAVDYEHPRAGAIGEGFLGDEIAGEVVVEVGEKHVSIHCTPQSNKTGGKRGHLLVFVPLLTLLKLGGVPFFPGRW